MQLTGKIVITVDGNRISSEKGASIDTGGIKRTPVVDESGVTHFVEENTAPALEFTVLHGKGVSLDAFKALKNTTAIAQADTGVSFIYQGAFTLEAGPLKDGRFSVKMSASSCEEA